MSALLRLEQLLVRRGEFTLGPVSLELPQGEYLAVVGPSGAGKTLLLESILGWQPASGKRLWRGQPWERSRPRVAYLSQHLPLLPHLSVEQNLLFGLACRRELPDPTLMEHLREVLGLAPYLGRATVSTLSRGEQQRLALAQALLTRPELLLLDEPSTALDPHRKPELWRLLQRLHRELGLTVLHVTHDRQEAFFLGQRIAVVLGGKLEQLAPPEELYRRPATLAVAQFFAPENLWPVASVVQENGQVRVQLAGYPVTLSVENPGTGQWVGIRPEEVALLDPHRPLRQQVQENRFAASVEELVFLDGQAQLAVRTSAGLPVSLRLPLCPVLDRGLAPGSQVEVCLKPRSLYLVPETPGSGR